jgi:hypothetical protein
MRTWTTHDTIRHACRFDDADRAAFFLVSLSSGDDALEQQLPSPTSPKKHIPMKKVRCEFISVPLVLGHTTFDDHPPLLFLRIIVILPVSTSCTSHALSLTFRPSWCFHLYQLHSIPQHYRIYRFLCALIAGFTYKSVHFRSSGGRLSATRCLNF